MSNKSLSKIFLLLIFLLFQKVSLADFVVVAHEGKTRTSSTGTLFIFGTPGEKAYINSKDGTFANFEATIGADGSVSVNVPLSQFFRQADNNTVLSKALFVTANTPISGYFVNQFSPVSDIAYLLDMEALGTKYRIASFDPHRTDNFGPAQMSVTATEDSTTIKITPTVDLQVYSSGTYTTIYPANTEFTVTLNKGESYYFVNYHEDLSGSLVVADKPVAVFSGVAWAQVDVTNSTADHLFSQMPPVTHYANEFVIPETALTGGTGDYIRVFADSNNTEISVNGTVVATLNAGDYHNILNASGGTVISTSQPSLVVDYRYSSSVTGWTGDTAMTFVPGAEQALDEYAFVAPNLVDRSNNPMRFYVAVAIKDSALASLTLDGVVVDTSGFTPIGSSGYSQGSFPVAIGTHRLKADDTFTAVLSGYGDIEGYLTILGASFSPGASPLPKTPAAPLNVAAIPSINALGLISLLAGLLLLATRFVPVGFRK